MIWNLRPPQPGAAFRIAVQINQSDEYRDVSDLPASEDGDRRINDQPEESGTDTEKIAEP